MLQWTWGCRYLFKIVISFLLVKYLKVESLDYMGVLFLIFWGNFVLFSIVAAQVCIPTNSVQGSPFLQILTNTCYFFLFENRHSNRCKVIISSWFWFAFPWWLVMLRTFHVSGHLYVFSGETSLQILCPVFNRVVFLYWIVWVLYIFWILVLCQIRFANTFYHSVVCLFISLMASFVVQKLFSLM